MQQVKTAFYDLQICPVTWSFADAILRAKDAGCQRFVIVDGQRHAKLTHFPPHEVKMRINSIARPLIANAGMEYVFIKNREDVIRIWSKDCYPRWYKPHMPKRAYRGTTVSSRVEVKSRFQPNPDLMQQLRTEYGNPIVMTIRQQRFQPERNANIPEWIAAGQELERQGFSVVIVPDFENPNTEFGGLRVCRQAASNMELRLALMHTAMVNFFGSNGPVAIAISDERIPAIYIHWLFPDCANSNADLLALMGFFEGQQPEGFGPNQWIAWSTDNREGILESFRQWCALNPERVESARTMECVK
jgi:hypothetical protein